MIRTFSIKDDVLQMSSDYEDEFGAVHLFTCCSLRATGSSDLRQYSDPSASMDMRIQEMRHFLNVLKLFDPNPDNDHGLSEVLSPAPPEPWET